MPDHASRLEEMNARSREVFRRVVEAYLASGEPVGSRTLTRSMSERVSAATVRNVMQDLEYMGLLDSPHISAGRVPTEAGLRMFVDAVLEVGDLDRADRETIDATLGTTERSTQCPAQRATPIKTPAPSFFRGSLDKHPVFGCERQCSIQEGRHAGAQRHQQYSVQHKEEAG